MTVFTVCIGEPSPSELRLPCGVAYPGVGTFVLHLAEGPPAAQGEDVSKREPRRPVILLSKTAANGVEEPGEFVDDLLNMAWEAQGKGDCVTGNYGSPPWGSGPITYFSRSTASGFFLFSH